MVKARDSDDVPKKKEKNRMHIEMQAGSSDAAATRIDPRVQAEIGKQLRAVYDDVIREPVPDKFLELLQELERSTSRKG